MDLIYIVSPLILITVVLAAVWLDRWSVPAILVALGGGILFGSDVLDLWHFEDAKMANAVANFALVFILFHGGFGIQRREFKKVALPAGGMATWGVIMTAGFTLLILWKVLEWPFDRAVMIAAIISSTDAAATLSILRRYTLPKRLSSTLIIESAANDPMAVLLTVLSVQFFLSGASLGWGMVPAFLWKFAGGPIIGLLMGRAAVWLFNALRPQERGHYYVLFFGVVLLTYGLAEEFGASGMLAVFIAGYVMGNRPFVHKQGVANFSAAFASVANIATFVLLGLLVFPRQLSHIWLDGLLLFLILTFFSRPLALLLGTMGMKIRETQNLHDLGGSARRRADYSGHLPRRRPIAGQSGYFQSGVFCGHAVGVGPRFHTGRGGAHVEVAFAAHPSGAAIQLGLNHHGPQRHGFDGGGFTGETGIHGGAHSGLEVAA